MSLRNQVQLIGNLGQDPEITTLESGKKLAKFSLATSETYKNDKNEKITSTEWHNLVAWGKTAEIVGYLKKGSQIVANGKITYNSYEDKEGNKRKNTQIVISEVVMLGSKE